MQHINEVLRAAENKLSRATELFASLKQAHADVTRQERQSRRREPDGMHDHAAASTASTWTEQQRAVRTLAGLEKDMPPVVGEITEQQARQRSLAGMLVKPATAVITRPSAFLPAFAQQAHYRIEVLDRALQDATRAVDSKASVDLEGFPKIMTAAELWRAIEEETSALRHAARP